MGTRGARSLFFLKCWTLLQQSIRVVSCFILFAGLILLSYQNYTNIRGKQRLVAQVELLKRKNNGMKAEILQLRDDVEEHRAVQSRRLEAVPTPSMEAYRPGLIVLGMHRSGTSVLTGLLSKMGLATGGNLLPPASANKKGYFERFDVTRQNDAFLARQGASYLVVEQYNHSKALMDIVISKNQFQEGQKSLAFLNSETNYPWVLKDPRLCITLRTWLPLLNFIPAVLFSYRHPLDVASSLANRDERLPLEEGVRLWYAYNRNAIMASHDLCRVVTSYKAVMSQPKEELDRIFDEAHLCGVPVPQRIELPEIEEFVDAKLQHGKAGTQQSCDAESLTLPWRSKAPERDLQLYREAMRVYCALEDRSAFRRDFEWDNTIHTGKDPRGSIALFQ